MGLPARHRKDRPPGLSAGGWASRPVIGKIDLQVCQRLETFSLERGEPAGWKAREPSTDLEVYPPIRRARRPILPFDGLESPQAIRRARRPILPPIRKAILLDATILSLPCGVLADARTFRAAFAALNEWLATQACGVLSETSHQHQLAVEGVSHAIG